MKRMKKRAAIVAGMVILAVGAAPFLWSASSTAVQGMYLDGTNVSGMDAEEISRLVSEKSMHISQGVLTVQYKTIREDWPFSDLKVRADTKGETAAILAAGRSGQPVKDWYDRWHTFLFGRNETMQVVWNEAVLDEKIKSLSGMYSAPPENARPLIAGDGTVSFSKGRPYMTFDAPKLKEEMESALAAGESRTVTIPVKEEQLPVLTEDQAKSVDQVLSMYTTEFSADPNRSYNIELASHKIDGILVQPGETFSFNHATGLRTKANGYLDAPVFLDGKLVPDAGGGVCQVSTTLFNAVLLAGLTVTERTCHFAPVAYVPIGRDATVADGYLDFKFRNDFTRPVYIHSVYSPGSLTLYILGNIQDRPAHVTLEEEGYKEIPYKTVFKLDPAQQEDVKTEEGHPGYQITLKQIVKRANGTTYKKSFFSDYDPVNTVVTFKDKKKKEEAEKKQAESETAAKAAPVVPKQN